MQKIESIQGDKETKKYTKEKAWNMRYSIEMR